MSQRLSRNSDMVAQLLRIRNIGWDAIIAGGAVRDTFHDRKISDVDIFVKANPEIARKVSNDFNSSAWVEYWSRVFKFDPKRNDQVKFFGDEYTFNGLDQNIMGVWEILKNTKRYQIILIKMDPREYIGKHFDFGICRAYCDGVKMHFTDEFLTDSMNQTITLYKEHRTEPQLIYALQHHLKKIQHKYPGWRPMLGDVDVSKYKK